MVRGHRLESDRRIAAGFEAGDVTQPPALLHCVAIHRIDFAIVLRQSCEKLVDTALAQGLGNQVLHREIPYFD